MPDSLPVATMCCSLSRRRVWCIPLVFCERHATKIIFVTPIKKPVRPCLLPGQCFPTNLIPPSHAYIAPPQAPRTPHQPAEIPLMPTSGMAGSSPALCSQMAFFEQPSSQGAFPDAATEQPGWAQHALLPPASPKVPTPPSLSCGINGTFDMRWISVIFDTHTHSLTHACTHTINYVILHYFIYLFVYICLCVSISVCVRVVLV